MISQVISWKFDHQPGMRCKEVDGEMVIIEFPGGIPSRAEQNQWTAEYQAHMAANPPQDAITVDDLFDALVDKGVFSRSERPTRNES